MKLYCFPTPRSVCVFALIDHIGAPVERINVDLIKGEHKKPEFSVINPNLKTPALVDGDLKLWEHPAIMLHIAEKAGSGLAPRTAEDRVNMTRWVSWMQMHWAEGADGLGGEFLAKPALGLGEPDPDVVARSKGKLAVLVPIVDAHLGANRYFLGENLSVVDFMFGGSIAHWRTCQMPLEEAENTLSWYSRLAALPAWKANFEQRKVA